MAKPRTGPLAKRRNWQVAKPGGWQVAKPGGWQVAKPGGWQLTKPGRWQVAKPGGWQVAKPGRWQVAKPGRWQLTKPGRWQLAKRRPLVTKHAPEPAGPAATRLRITVRGALLGMFTICLAADLMANLLHGEVLIGIGFCAACVLAPAYVRRQALLEIVAAPPVTFLLSLVVVQALTAQGDGSHATLLSVLEGTLLTLAAIAPWLFAGTALCLIISVRRGLMQCIRDLDGDLRGQVRPDSASARER